MKKCKITVLKRANHLDLQEKYENPIAHACMMTIGQEFISIDAQIPEGMCQSAWQNLYPYVFALASGAKDFFDGWMKNPNQACISCNDGFRPVSYLIEAID